MECPAASFYAFCVISFVVIVGMVCGTWGGKSSVPDLREEYRNAPDWAYKLALLYKMTRGGIFGATVGVAAIGFPAAASICFDLAGTLNAFGKLLDRFWPSETPVPNLAPPTNLPGETS